MVTALHCRQHWCDFFLWLLKSSINSQKPSSLGVGGGELWLTRSADLPWGISPILGYWADVVLQLRGPYLWRADSLFNRGYLRKWGWQWKHQHVWSAHRTSRLVSTCLKLYTPFSLKFKVIPTFFYVWVLDFSTEAVGIKQYTWLNLSLSELWHLEIYKSIILWRPMGL